jgi:hypothetical protein
LFDRHHNRLADTLRLLELIELARADFEHCLIDDAVSAIDRLRLVADHGHGRCPRDAGALEIANGRSPEIVWDAFDAGCLACLAPRGVVVANQLSIPPGEHPRDLRLLAAFDLRDPGALTFQDLARPGCELEFATRGCILRLARLEPKPSPVAEVPRGAIGASAAPTESASR